MKITLKVSFISAAVFSLSAVSGFAQSSGRVSVKVPFEFTAGSSNLPAGEYNFTGDRSGVLFISSVDTRKSIVVLTNPGINKGEANQPVLKFDKVNGMYNLAEVDVAGEPSLRLVKSETPTGRPASLGSRTTIGSTSKSLTK